MNIESIKVLLIDDDEDDFVNIGAVLNEIEGSEYHLDWKGSYQSGLEALRTGRYDVCLFDFRLGELSGLDLLREAKRLGIPTPMILLTGHGDFELDIKAMQTGAADYLVKGQIGPLLLERAVRYSVKHALDVSELTEQKENFKILFNSTFEGIVVHDAGQIVDANASMGHIFGVEPSELIGKSVRDFVNEKSQGELAALLSADATSQIECTGNRADGTEVRLGLSGKVIVLSGSKRGLLAVRDLSIQKQMEAQILQQDRLASLGLLASSLAHEIGTPLGVIRGRAEMCAKTDNEKLKGTMEVIISQIDRVAKLVNSLLHIARGKTSENVANVDLGAVINDVLNLMNPELERKSIKMHTQVPTGIIVRAESGPLGQVFLNLLVNSVHAIEEAQTHGRRANHKVSIEAECEGAQVKIVVRDTGCGISQSNMRQLFKPFFTTKDIGFGTGLGLATSYKIMQSWNGSISVESKEGEGSTFTLILPAG